MAGLGVSPARESAPAPSRAICGMLLTAVAVLLAFGLTMVFTTSSVSANEAERFGDGFAFFRRQAVFLGIGVVAFAVLAFTDYRRLLKLAVPLYVATLALLVGVLAVGTTVNGATRWLSIGGFTFQPSELAKFTIVLAAVSLAVSRGSKLASFRLGFLPACLLLAPLSLLIIRQPDLGTSVFVAALGFLVLLAAGVRFTHVGIIAAVALPAVVGLMFLSHGHVQDRILNFLDPEADIRGKGHQVYQSLIAIGSGGPTGKGLGESTQKLRFLPEEHTDFIFAVLVEELGLLGAAGLIAAFLLLIYAGARAARHAPDAAGALLAFGFTAAVTLQAAMNMAVVTASVPTKGISLPFISFGGSGLVIALASCGVLMNIARQAVTREQAMALRLESWGSNAASMPSLPRILPPSACSVPLESSDIPRSEEVSRQPDSRQFNLADADLGNDFDQEISRPAAAVFDVDIGEPPLSRSVPRIAAP